jgi:adenylylsulfate kinase
VTYQESAIEFTDDAPVIWFTGMSSAGKSTLCLHLREKLAGAGYRVEWLDGDEFRRILSTDLVFSRQDRDEQVKRIGHLAQCSRRDRARVSDISLSSHEGSSPADDSQIRGGLCERAVGDL